MEKEKTSGMKHQFHPLHQICLTYDEFSSIIFLAWTGPMVDPAEPWFIMHDSIKPISKQQTKSKITGPIKLTADKTSTSELKAPESSIIVPNQHKISININKNAVLSNYSDFCIPKGINAQVLTIFKGKKVPSTTTYPLHYCLITKCKMKPSNNL